MGRQFMTGFHQRPRDNKPQDIGGQVERLVMRNTPNKGIRVKRTAYNPRELAIAEHWADECEPKSWLNYGCGLVQDLFMNRPIEAFMQYHCKAQIVLTNRERMIAATCIQWLGSNCGFAFLHEALAKCGYKIVKVKVSHD